MHQALPHSAALPTSADRERAGSLLRIEALPLALFTCGAAAIVQSTRTGGFAFDAASLQLTLLFVLAYLIARCTQFALAILTERRGRRAAYARMLARQEAAHAQKPA
jgi:hypothetical protein